MRFVIPLLLAIPIALAVNCIVGGSIGDPPTGFFSPTSCLANEQFCFTMDITTAGVHTITKDCGTGLCKEVGYNSTAHVDCCKGDYCNTTAGSSSLITVFSTVIAVCLWS